MVEEKDYFDAEVPMCVVCEKTECDTTCVRVTALISAQNRTADPAKLRKAHLLDQITPDKPKFSTTIKRDIWAMKMEDLEEKGHFYEYKSDIGHWKKRLENLISAGLPVRGSFLVGGSKEAEKVIVTEVEMDHKHRIEEKYAKTGLIKTPFCWIIKCEPVGV